MITICDLPPADCAKCWTSKKFLSACSYGREDNKPKFVLEDFDMSSLWIAGISVALLVLGYVFYTKKVKQWIGVDDDEPVPAVTMRDGVDYVPAKHWTILFGHHFASIAGAAPIIGPVIACLFWGWLPAVIWVVVGGIFFGAVHDYISLIMSMRNGGKLITTVTETVMGKTSKLLFGVFAFLALILVVHTMEWAAVRSCTIAAPNRRGESPCIHSSVKFPGERLLHWWPCSVYCPQSRLPSPCRRQNIYTSQYCM